MLDDFVDTLFRHAELFHAFLDLFELLGGSLLDTLSHHRRDLTIGCLSHAAAAPSATAALSAAGTGAAAFTHLLQAFLDLFVRHERLRPHLHISLQSGSSSVLARMKRPYRGQRAWDALREVAAVAPHFGIGADLIVGFPGETDAEFEETRRLVEDSAFSYLHVFRFSRRPGTAAADMPGQVHPETISERGAALRDLAAAKQDAFALSMVGTTREAVVEDEGSRPGWRQATTDNYATVMVPDRFGPGALVRVTIDAQREGLLWGTALPLEVRA